MGKNACSPARFAGARNRPDVGNADGDGDQLSIPAKAHRYTGTGLASGTVCVGRGRKNRSWLDDGHRHLSEFEMPVDPAGSRGDPWQIRSVRQMRHGVSGAAQKGGGAGGCNAARAGRRCRRPEKDQKKVASPPLNTPLILPRSPNPTMDSPAFRWVPGGRSIKIVQQSLPSHQALQCSTGTPTFDVPAIIGASL